MHWSLEESWAANEATLGFRDAVALDARACWSSTRPSHPPAEDGERAEKTEMAACPDSILSNFYLFLWYVYIWYIFGKSFESTIYSGFFGHEPGLKSLRACLAWAEIVWKKKKKTACGQAQD